MKSFKPSSFDTTKSAIALENSGLSVGETFAQLSRNTSELIGSAHQAHRVDRPPDRDGWASTGR